MPGGDLTLGQMVEFLMGPFGTLFLVIFILIAGYRRMWVFGWYATELKQRNERLENRIDRISTEARSITSVAEKTTTLAVKKAEVASE